MSLAQLIECVAETTLSLPMRAIANWCVESGKEGRIGRDDLPALMARSATLAPWFNMVSATRIAATTTVSVGRVVLEPKQRRGLI